MTQGWVRAIRPKLTPLSSSSKNLPEFIVEDILLRLPVKSLLRFRCVCKSWCALITDPTFVKMHLNRSIEKDTNRSLIFIGSPFKSVDLDACEMQAVEELELPPLKPPKYSYQETKIGGSCNGLLCIYNSVEDMFLWNPSTKRHRKLPFSPTESLDPYEKCDSFNLGLGYDPTSDDYKLVRIAQFSGSRFKSYSNSEVKVYSLSSNSWRNIPYMAKPFFLINNPGFGVLANSALHWVAFRETGPDPIGSSFIISIDLQDEKYREVLLPDCKVTPLTFLGVRGGQLCAFYQFLDRVEVWVMKDYGMGDSWVKELSIEQSVLRDGDDIKPVYYSKNGELILEIDFNALVLYDPSRGSARKLRIRGAHRIIGTKNCVGSLVPLYANGGIEQAETKKKNRTQRVDVEIGRLAIN
ncbi:F-box protein CPR1-like [Macadamia integrifolia]|uniref:F-box protein CPR1-like n=1 Tax=Macadamia integrifolia TaxID=60698 RepID=UPI001C52CD24|nr:F-box protein CPR1-like [Macadamia integrifolia]